MSGKAFHVTVSDLISPKASVRLKILEAIKDRAIEWPDTFDEYIRLISMVCECVRQAASGSMSMSGTKSILVHGLGSLSFLLEDFSHSDISIKICQLVTYIMDQRVESHLGAIEYVFKIIRQTSFAHVSSSSVSIMLTKLLGHKTNSPRQLELVRLTVWSILSQFWSDFSSTHLASIFKSLLQLFSAASRVPEMLFCVQLSLLLAHRNAIDFRIFVRENFDLIQSLIKFLVFNDTLLGQTSISLLRFILPLLDRPIELSSEIEFEVSKELYLELYQFGYNLKEPPQFGRREDLFLVEQKLLNGVDPLFILEQICYKSNNKLFPEWKLKNFKMAPMLMNFFSNKSVSTEIQAILLCIIPIEVPQISSVTCIVDLQILLKTKIDDMEKVAIESLIFLSLPEFLDLVFFLCSNSFSFITNKVSDHSCSLPICLECINEEIVELRSALVFQPKKIPCLKKSFPTESVIESVLKFLKNIINTNGLDSNNILASSYLLIGSLLPSIRCDPCVLSRIMKSVPTLILQESTNFLNGKKLKLCTCSLHEIGIEDRLSQFSQIGVQKPAANFTPVTSMGHSDSLMNRLKMFSQMDLFGRIKILEEGGPNELIGEVSRNPLVEKSSYLCKKIARLSISKNMGIGFSKNPLVQLLYTNYFDLVDPDLIVDPNSIGNVAVWVSRTLREKSLQTCPPAILFSEHFLYILDELKKVISDRELCILFSRISPPNLRDILSSELPGTIVIMDGIDYLKGEVKFDEQRIGHVCGKFLIEKKNLSAEILIHCFEIQIAGNFTFPILEIAESIMPNFKYQFWFGKYINQLFPKFVDIEFFSKCPKKHKIVHNELFAILNESFIQNENYVEWVPLMYELILSTESSFPSWPSYSDAKLLGPIPYCGKKEYPTSKNTALVSSLVSAAFSNYVSCNESLSIKLYPHLTKSESIVNDSISLDTCVMIASGVNYRDDIDFQNLAFFCLQKGAAETAYWLIDIAMRRSVGTVVSNKLTLLFQPPSPLLSLLLSTMAALKIQLHSLPLTLHPSVRPQVAKLRGDFFSLLFEKEHDGISFLNVPDWKNICVGNFSYDAIGRNLKGNTFSPNELENYFVYLQRESVPKDKFVRLSLLTELCRICRKNGFLHQSRIIGDWTATNMISETTLPEQSILLYYQLSKSLFALNLVSEATELIKAICESPEAGRTDSAPVMMLMPSIQSRAGLWLGQLRLETIETIQSRFFEKAIQSTPKQILKSKIRQVKVLKQYPEKMVLEFTTICEILSVVEKKTQYLSSRFISLWFSNLTTMSPIVSQFRKTLASSKSILPFFYQIAGRLIECKSSEIINFAVACVSNHLVICLPAILQLGSAGQKVIDKLSLVLGPAELEKMNSMMIAFKFYLSLAMMKVDPPMSISRTRGSVLIPVSSVSHYTEYVRKIQAGACTILTSRDHVVLKSIVPTFSIADSGKSLPKIVKVVDVDGREYAQIVKGNDDLRNDAVLQQLFQLLGVQTYQVVPISARAGVAEWVNGTTTLGTFLTQAHLEYNPSELEPDECKLRMSKTKTKLSTYLEICKLFTPCLHYFFYEKFSNPKFFFAAQTAFSNSVAATSLMGFIVGLGDRHPNNILISEISGEVIHIDYGICFDAGTFLKVPEIVPFRLTRDMVDALGVLGTQGPFAKTCEDVLLSLKSQSELVISIVEVFVVDPLFNWAVSSLKSDNAVEALKGVKRKLQGFMEINGLPLTPRAQIDRLIRGATDEECLALMFPGWQAWL